MADGSGTRRPRRTKAQVEIIERVRDKSPDVIITLVSIFLGVVFADTVQEARARMVLWPLSLPVMITWAQLLFGAVAGLTAWAIFAQFAIARRTVPTVGESVSALLAPLLLLFLNSFVGKPEVWAWYLAGSAFCLSSVVTNFACIHFGKADLPALTHMMRPTGYLLPVWGGLAVIFPVGVLDALGRVPVWLNLMIIMGATPLAVAHLLLFFRDWRRALEPGAA